MGFVLVGILSAAMSTYSSIFNSLAAVTIEDFFARDKKLDAKTYILWSRLASLFWMGVCVVASCFVGNFATTVIEAINKIGSLFYGPILMLFLLAILSKRTTSLGVNIGLIVGVAANIYVWKCQPQIFWFWWNVIGAVVTFVVVYLVRVLYPLIILGSEKFFNSFLFPENLGHPNLQQNSIISFSITRQMFDKHPAIAAQNTFQIEKIIWNKRLIRYSILFFIAMILVSFLLERIL